MKCTPAGKKCPTTYHMPHNLDWSNLEKETDLNKQNEEEDETEDWYGNIQKQKELEKQELQKDNSEPSLSRPNSMLQSTSGTDDTETFIPQLTDTLVTSGTEEQEDNHSGDDDSEDSKDCDSEDTIHNIV